MIWSGFIVGLLGSVHCIGMCGPLALAVPTKKGHRVISAVLFNGGRILTYAFLGALFGLIGLGFQLIGFQTYLSIATGVFVIALVVFPAIQHKFHWSGGEWIRTKIAGLMKKKSLPSIFSLGVLNGFLPCGLIYIAVAGAIETGFVESAAVYMVFFGIGTSLVLFLTMMSKDLFAKIKSHKPKRIVPYLTVLLGILFIVRGFLYMIPPEIQENNMTVQVLQTITMCHVR